MSVFPEEFGYFLLGNRAFVRHFWSTTPTCSTHPGWQAMREQSAQGRIGDIFPTKLRAGFHIFQTTRLRNRIAAAFFRSQPCLILS